MFKAFRTALAVLLLTGLPTGPWASPAGFALEVHDPEDRVIRLDLAALDALPQESFVTRTIWTDGDLTFSGVPLAALLDHFGADQRDGRIELVALNDYRIEIPVSEIEETTPIVATRVNGAPMPVREKGPYWVVYPYDHAPRYRTETTFARSIWQLAQLHISP